MERKALRRDAGVMTVLREQRVPLESDLQRALVTHPEALPAQDLGLTGLTSLASELDCGAGPMDQLAVDASGQLVIVEYKKGTENTDVRRVIAQLLDYGSALWRRPLDELERECAENGARPLVELGTSIADHVSRALSDVEIDKERFNENLRSCLEVGSFVFLYVARDLDARTRRVMTFLAEAQKLRFYAVEIDWFAADDGSSVIVPRVAYVPSVIVAGPAPAAPVDPATDELISRIDAVARDAGLTGKATETGRSWGLRGLVGVYRTSRGFSISLPLLDNMPEDDTRSWFLGKFAPIFPGRRLAPHYPSLPPSLVLSKWSEVEPLLRLLFVAQVRAEALWEMWEAEREDWLPPPT